MTTSLSDDIAFYEERRQEIEADHLSSWIVVHNRKVEGFYPSFSDAASDAVRRFGRGPYLIRQVGAAASPVPASVLYRPINANSTLRL